MFLREGDDMNNSTTAARCETSATKKSIPASWSRFLVLKMLAGLQHGQIILQEGDKKWVFGKSGSLRAHLTVNHKSFYRKILFGGSIGGGEAYVDGIWKVDDLTVLVRIMVLNMALLDRMEHGFAWLLRPADLFATP